jgi:F-type H+-transporting ATPase subunit delta
VQRFVLLLLERRRIVLLPSIARAYRDMADAHLGRVRAQITSAEPLAAAALDRVRRSLEQRTGKQVIVETAVDPDLIGGLVARVGDLVLDGSVRTQLSDLRAKLLN